MKKRNKFLNAPRGITLVTLAVTVIVMLILAGVTIKLATGDSGIINSAINARAESRKAEELDIIKSAYSSLLLKDAMSDTGVTKIKLQEEINKKGLNCTGVNDIDEEGKKGWWRVCIKAENPNDGDNTYDINPDDGSGKFSGNIPNSGNPDIQIEISKNPEKYTKNSVNVTINLKINGKTEFNESEYEILWGNDEKNLSNEYDKTKGINVNECQTIIVKVVRNATKYSIQEEFEINNIDRNAPIGDIDISTTTNSVTVTANATDAPATKEDACSGIKEYRFKEDENDWTAWQTSNVYKFENLTQTTNYNIKVEVKDKAGNTATLEKSGTTSTVANLKVDVTNPDTWSNTSKKVTITAGNNNYKTIRYTTNGTKPTATTGTEIKSGGTFTVSKNCTIYAVAYDSTNQAGVAASATVTKIDKLAPSAVSFTETHTTNSIKVTASATDAPATTEDGCSGIKEYRFNKDGGSTWTAWQASNVYEFTNLTQTTNYNIKVEAKDNAGNTANSVGTTTTQEVKGTIIVGTPTWNGTTATVTFSTSSGFYIQTKVRNGNWSANPESTGSATASATTGTTIYARLTDNLGQTTAESAYVSITPILTYTVAYDGNGATGGSTASSTHNYGAEKVLTKNGFTKNGYTFTGWNTKANGTGTAYTDSQSVTNLTNMNGATVTLYAQWNVNTYTITYDLAGGTVSGINPTSYTTETNDITLINPTKEGYTFTGWTGSNGTTPETTVKIVKGSTGNKTYTANWKINTYAITYNLVGGTVTGTNPTSYTIGTGDITLINPTKEGYTFTGWTGSNGTTPQTTVKIIKGSTGNKTYTANWKINTYTVTINSSNASYGTVSKTSITVDYGTKYSASGNTLTIGSNTVTATKIDQTGYTTTFDGWNPSSGTITGATTITANFSRAINSCTVTIKSDLATYGSTSQSTLTVDYGTTYSVSGNTLSFSNGSTVTATPKTITGYNTSFTGWSSSSGTITGATTITAKFTGSLKEYTVTVQSNNSDYGSVACDTSNLNISVSDIWCNGDEDYTFNSDYFFESYDDIEIGFEIESDIECEIELPYLNINNDLNVYWNTDSPIGSDGGELLDLEDGYASWTLTLNKGTTYMYVERTGSTPPLQISFDEITTRSFTVKHGTSVSASGNTLTIGSNTVTATKIDQTGYTTTFTGWSKSSGTITGNTTITANFSRTINTYKLSITKGTGVNTIYYSTNGGSTWTNTTSSVSKYLVYGSSVKVYWTASEGYTSAYSSTSKCRSGTIGTSGLSFSASCTANTYTLTFDMNLPSVNAVFGEDSGTSFSLYDPSSGTYKNQEQMKSQNYKWSKTFTYGSSTVVMRDDGVGTGFCNKPKLKGYTINGLTTTGGEISTTQNGSYTDYIFNAKYAGNVTIKCSWTPKTYKLTLDNQGAEVAGTTAVYDYYNNAYFLDVNHNSMMSGTGNGITIPTKKGYTFGGYYTGTNGTGNQCIQASGLLNESAPHFTSDTTLYALWTDKNGPTYTSYEMKNVSTDGFEVYVYGVSDATGIERADFYVWTGDPYATDRENFTGHRVNYTNNGQFYFKVNISDHNNASGQYTVNCYLYDTLGYSTGIWVGTENVPKPAGDTVAPTLTITSATTNSITYSATDNVGVTGYYVSTSSSKPAATASGWITTTTKTGLYSNTQYYVWAKDAAGNVSATKSITTKSITAPTIGTPSWSGTSGFTATVKITGSQAGCTLQYKKGYNGTWTPINSGYSVTGISPGTILYARLYDGKNSGVVSKTIDAVAIVGTTGYDKLTSAISAISSSGTIYLCKDSSSSATYTIPSGKNITLNLNGKTLTCTLTSNYVFTVYGTLNLEEGTLTSKCIAIRCMAGANVNMKSGTINADSTGIEAGNGKITINGGTVSGNQYGIYGSGNANITMTAGSIQGNITGIYSLMNSGGYINITGGTIMANNKYGIYAEYGNRNEHAIDISNATVKGGSAGIYIHKNDVEVTSYDAVLKNVLVSGTNSGIEAYYVNLSILADNVNKTKIEADIDGIYMIGGKLALHEGTVVGGKNGINIAYDCYASIGTPDGRYISSNPIIKGEEYGVYCNLGTNPRPSWGLFDGKIYGKTNWGNKGATDYESGAMIKTEVSDEYKVLYFNK